MTGGWRMRLRVFRLQWMTSSAERRLECRSRLQGTYCDYCIRTRCITYWTFIGTGRIRVGQSCLVHAGRSLSELLPGYGGDIQAEVAARKYRFTEIHWDQVCRACNPCDGPD